MKEPRPRRKPSLAAPLRWVGLTVRALLGPPARAVRGTARRVADPARQVVDYWGSERRTMRQAFVAVIIASATSLVAGLVLAGMDHRMEQIPGLFVLIPVSIGMRGNIFGALAARLGTSIHMGLFVVSRRRDSILYQNVYAATLLTIATSVTMALLARSIAALLHIPTVSIWDLTVIALAGGLLSSAVVLALTVLLSVKSLQRGWDLDTVGAPMITAMGDVVTLPCLLLASYLADIDFFTAVAGAAAMVIGGIALVRGWTVVMPVARRIVRESFPVLCIAIVLDVLAGSVIEPRLETVFFTWTAFLIIIPGFLENTGALGSVLAARLGSKLHLGAVTPTARPEAAALLDGSIVLVLGLTVYLLTAGWTLVASEIFNRAYPGVATFIGVVALGGLLATLVAGVIGYYAAIISYRLGLDPDNHTIPLVTSGMDLLGVICLVVALVVFQVA